MEVWALNFATTGELIKNLMDTTHGQSDKKSTHHNEETMKRIQSDQQDRERLRQYMHGIIDPMNPMNPSTHSDVHLLNIV